MHFSTAVVIVMLPLKMVRGRIIIALSAPNATTPSIGANRMRGAGSATGNNAWERWHCTADEALTGGGSKNHAVETHAFRNAQAHRPTPT